MLNGKKNVQNKVVRMDICLQCGFCISQCPISCIEWKVDSQNNSRQIVVDNDKCVECNICSKICPSINPLNQNTDLIGNNRYKKSFMGWANDISLRKNGTSGGIIAAIISHFIKNDLVDYIFTLPNIKEDYFVKMDIIKSIDEINEIQKSKYVPASFEMVSSYIKNDNKILFTGLPCHIHALNNIITHKKLNRENFVFIGLFCDGCMSYKSIDYFKYNLIPKNENLVAINFRDKLKSGWPGNVMIKSNICVRFFEKQERLFIKKFFKLRRCDFCIDKLNTHADVSIGDCYSKLSTIEGENHIIVRNIQMNKILQSMVDQNEIKLLTEDYENIKKVQKIDKKYENLKNMIINNSEFININEYDLNLKIHLKDIIKSQQKKVYNYIGTRFSVKLIRVMILFRYFKYYFNKWRNKNE